MRRRAPRTRVTARRSNGVRISSAEIDALALGLRRSSLHDDEEFDPIRTTFPGAPPSAPFDNAAAVLDEPYQMVRGYWHIVYPLYLGGCSPRADVCFLRWKALGFAMWVFSLGVSFDSDDERWAAAHRFASVIIDPSVAVCRRTAAPLKLPREPHRRPLATTPPVLGGDVMLVSAMAQLCSGAAA